MKKVILSSLLFLTLGLLTSYAQKACVGVHYTPIGQYPVALGSHYSWASFIMSSGDFDNDGKEDLAFIGYSIGGGTGQNIVLQRNIRTGTLPSQVSFDTSVSVFHNSNTLDFVVGDFNNDGKKDIAIIFGSYSGPDTLQVLINHGSTGVFAFYAMPPLALDSNEINGSLKTDDFDHDGKQDLMYVSSAKYGSASTFIELLNTGYTSTSASFSNSKSTKIIMPYSYSAIYAEGDMNNDNLPEVAFVKSPDTVMIYQNTSTTGTANYKLAQKYVAPENVNVVSGWRGNTVQIRDINVDGKADIAILYSGGTQAGQKLLFLINKTTGSNVTVGFSDTMQMNHFVGAPYTYKLDDTGGAMSLDPGIDFSDFSFVNNDPCHIRPDILLSVEGCCPRSYSLMTYIANTSSLSKISYSNPCWFEHFTSDRAGVGDFNGDGKDDLVSNCDVCLTTTPDYGLSILENVSTIPNGSNKVYVDTVKIPCQNVAINGNIKAKLYLPCKVYKHYGTDTVTLKWTPGISASDTATLFYNQYYSVHVFNQSHSFDTVLHIIFHDPNGNAIAVSFSDTTICAGRTIKLNVSNYNKQYSYYWWPTTNMKNDSTPNPLVNPTVTTTYNVTATGGKCVTNNTVVVHVHAPPVVLTAPSDTIVCVGRPVVLNAYGGVSYVWKPRKYLNFDSIQSPTARVDTTVTFKVEGYDGYCFADATATITVLPAPKVHAGNRWTIHTNESHYIGDSYVSGDYFNYWWKPAIYMNDTTLIHPTVAPPISMWYYLSAVNAYGCFAEDSIFIKFDPLGHITVPNSFTPNADGLNDFLVINKENIRTFHIEIYNRWGQLVFTADNLYRNWDGRFNGEPEPVGSYVYFIQATDVGGHPVNLQGNITLLR